MLQEGYHGSFHAAGIAFCSIKVDETQVVNQLAQMDITVAGHADNAQVATPKVDETRIGQEAINDGSAGQYGHVCPLHV